MEVRIILATVIVWEWFSTPAVGRIGLRRAERVLAACDRVFGHRLMMDRIVPGGTEEVSPGGARGVLAMLEEIEKPFAEIVRTYDNTPSLQDRTCKTGFVSRELVTQWAAGGHVGRASGRDFDCRRDFPYAPYRDVEFAVPVLTAGDVDARVWIRIREIDQSMRLIKGWLADLPAGPTRVALPNVEGACEGIAMTEAFRGDVLVWVRIVDGRIERCHARAIGQHVKRRAAVALHTRCAKARYDRAHLA